jgi:hypothetical protein
MYPTRSPGRLSRRRASRHARRPSRSAGDLRRDERPYATRIGQLLDQGVSLLLFPRDAHLPAIDALLARIRAGTRDRVPCGAIVTTGAGGAFALHYDARLLRRRAWGA